MAPPGMVIERDQRLPQSEERKRRQGEQNHGRSRRAGPRFSGIAGALFNRFCWVGQIAEQAPTRIVGMLIQIGAVPNQPIG